MKARREVKSINHDELRCMDKETGAHIRLIRVETGVRITSVALGVSADVLIFNEELIDVINWLVQKY